MSFLATAFAAVLVMLTGCGNDSSSDRSPDSTKPDDPEHGEKADGRNAEDGVADTDPSNTEASNGGVSTSRDSKPVTDDFASIGNEFYLVTGELKSVVGKSDDHENTPCASEELGNIQYFSEGLFRILICSIHYSSFLENDVPPLTSARQPRWSVVRASLNAEYDSVGWYMVRDARQDSYEVAIFQGNKKSKAAGGTGYSVSYYAKGNSDGGCGDIWFAASVTDEPACDHLKNSKSENFGDTRINSAGGTVAVRVLRPDGQTVDIPMRSLE